MFRFTIRDVLWLTVVVGMGTGWWINSRYWVTTNQALAKENRALQQEARLANEQSDKAWAAARDPFYRPDPLDDLWNRKRPGR